MISIYRIRLNVHKDGIQCTLCAAKGDTARRIEARFFDGAKPMQIPLDGYAVFSAEKPDGRVVYNDCIIRDDGTVVYDFTDQTVSVPGRMVCSLILYDREGHVLASPIFVVSVREQVVSEGDLNSVDEFLSLTKLYSELLELSVGLSKVAETVTYDFPEEDSSAVIAQCESDDPAIRTFRLVKVAGYRRAEYFIGGNTLDNKKGTTNKTVITVLGEITDSGPVVGHYFAPDGEIRAVFVQKAGSFYVYDYSYPIRFPEAGIYLFDSVGMYYGYRTLSLTGPSLILADEVYLEDGSTVEEAIARLQSPVPDTTLTKSGQAADAAAVGNSIGQTRAKMERVESHNIWNIANAMLGYVDLSGTFQDSTTLKFAVFDVSEGDVIRSYSWDASLGKYGPYSMRFVTAYSSAAGVVPSSGKENVGSYTVPSGITKLAITISTALVSPFITKNSEYIPTEPYSYFEPYYKATPEFVESAIPVYNGSWRYTGSLEDRDEILFPFNNIKKNTVFSFSGTLGTLGTLTLGRKSGSTVNGHVEIDSTSVKVYTGATTLKTTFTHGLTPSNNIQVKLETRPAGESSVYSMYQIRVRLVTGGSEFLSDWVQFDGQSMGSPYIAVSGGSFPSVSASWAAGDADCNIYAFGDSYFSFYSGRWTKYLYNDGYIDHVLLNAYAGESSSNGLQAFRNVMKLGHPGFCFWCMGMNDADNGAVNSEWKKAYHAMTGYCNDHGITPILATIPCTPTVDNSYKNAVIRSSGYRYVDFAKAVGAESAGSSWYEGMLSSDNVHPTDAGALALYMQILADFPEIAANDDSGKAGPQGPSGTAGKSSYQYAVEGGYTGTEAEFAAKLAEEMPEALPNPHPINFTGAVTGSYDGSEPLEVEIPSGGNGASSARFTTYAMPSGATVEIPLVSGMQFIAYAASSGSIEFAFTNSSIIYKYDASTNNSLWGLWVETSAVAGSFIPSGGAARTYVTFGSNRSVCTVKNATPGDAIVITIE